MISTPDSDLATVADANDRSTELDTWLRLDRLLDELLTLTGHERDARLMAIAGLDHDLAERLRRLLAGLQHSVGVDTPGRPKIWAEAFETLSDLHAGQVLGTWTLAERIGQGGMAEVFRAERRLNGASQVAALKVMSTGVLGVDQRRRFLQETEILARLDDPRLSRLIDAGSTADGRPWLAMEYVDGEAIDRACDRQERGIFERVALVRDAALAVDHAHRQLIVHRDLKPANILVDERGQVRVLDFGIAKIVPTGAVDVQATATQARAYTPRYASPEQLTGASTGVAGDVYQLGLLLFQLVTGSHPFADSDHDPARRLAAMREGPSAPSRQCQGASSASASRHGTTPARWPRLLRGDLDSIVLQALQADPDKRYAGARELADDLQNWLDGRTVNARAYSRSFRLARWLRRHWLGASAAALIVVLVFGYAATATWQGLRLAAERDEAQQARLRAESIQGFLARILESVDTLQTEQRGKSVDRMLVEAAELAPVEFIDQPAVAAQLLLDLSGVLLRRGRLVDAETTARAGLDLARERLGSEHRLTVDMLVRMAEILGMLHRPEQALPFAQEHLAAQLRLHGPDSAQAINATIGLAMIETRLGDWPTAEARLIDQYDRHRRVFGDGPWQDETVALLFDDLVHQHARTLHEGKRDDEAEPRYAQVVRNWAIRFGELDLRTVSARKNWAAVLLRLERTVQAREQLEQVLASERDLFDSPHWQIAYTLGHLGSLASSEQDHARAAEHWLQAEQEARAALSSDHPWPDRARMRAARALIEAGHPDQARPLLLAIAALQDRGDDLAEQAAQLLGESNASVHRSGLRVVSRPD